MKNITILFLFIFFFIPISTQAQMFSVGETEERQPLRLKTYSVIGVGIEFADFSYTGANGIGDEFEPVSFEGSILRLRFENPGINISAGFGGSLTGLENNSYININALLYNDFPLVRTQKFIFALPLQIGTDLKSVQVERSNNNFQQSSFTIGTGASLRYQINRRVGTSLRATPNIGFSFSQGNLFGGRLLRGIIDARFYFNDVFGSAALVFGYDFDYRDYNIDGTQNDYDYFSHAITIGLAF